MIELKKSALAAAALCVDDKRDNRETLRGVLVERTGCGETYIVGTNGHVLFACSLPALECEQKGPWKIIVPMDAVRLAIKSRNYLLTLSPLPDGRYLLGDVAFTAIDGLFPDWRRVVPHPATMQDKIEGQYNPHLLALASDALDTCEDRPKNDWGQHHILREGSPGSGVMHGESAHALAVVMGLRCKVDMRNFFVPA